MEDAETFTLLPIHLDPTSKAITTTSSSRALKEELAALNTLHRTILTIDSPVPPPPIPVNPKRSANITKLRESGNAEFGKKKYAEAIKFYTLGLQMALTRPQWEPSGLVRDEIAGLYANRAQCHMELRNWVEGSIDAEASIEGKKVGNAKAWWRKGTSLIEMGRLEEAREWVDRGLEMEGNDEGLLNLLKVLEEKEKALA